MKNKMIVYWPKNWKDYELIAHIKNSALASELFKDIVKVEITIKEVKKLKNNT